MRFPMTTVTIQLPESVFSVLRKDREEIAMISAVIAAWDLGPGESEVLTFARTHPDTVRWWMTQKHDVVPGLWIFLPLGRVELWFWPNGVVLFPRSLSLLWLCEMLA